MVQNYEQKKKKNPETSVHQFSVGFTNALTVTESKTRYVNGILVQFVLVDSWMDTGTLSAALWTTV